MLENSSYLSKCASFQFRKQILHILSSKVKNHIREEIGDSKFCIVLDAARDQSEQEQMALVLRFVDRKTMALSSPKGQYHNRALF